MSREQNYTGIILKKQVLGESDEIVTFFTKELGKIRALAKSVKSSKSKLQQRLQALFLVNFTLTGGKLPKIIFVEPLSVFMKLRENLFGIKAAFVACELVLKFAPDEQKNVPLFQALVDFFEFLNEEEDQLLVSLGLIKFKLAVLEASGLGVALDAGENDIQTYFSAHGGGFTQVAGGQAVLPAVVNIFRQLRLVEFKNLAAAGIPDAGQNQLQQLLSEFIEYQLERRLKSETFFNQGAMV
jgi:DNA repair protein RecO (recombination protein O)